MMMFRSGPFVVTQGAALTSFVEDRWQGERTWPVPLLKIANVFLMCALLAEAYFGSIRLSLRE